MPKGPAWLTHTQSINKFTSDDRWYTAIGRFIFEFSQLEFTLKYYVAEAIGLAALNDDGGIVSDQHFDTIMHQFDFARLCDIAESVLLEPRGTGLPVTVEGVVGGPAPVFHQTAAEHEASKRKQTQLLKKLINECKSLNIDRNRVVHGLWSMGERPELNYVSRTFNKSSHFGDPEQLGKKADEAARLRMEISNWATMPFWE